MTARLVLVAFAWIGAFASTVCLSAEPYLKEMPKDGDIPFRKVVYVDDGECPKGEVKEVTGGSRVKEVPRTVRCVKRPDKSPEK